MNRINKFFRIAKLVAKTGDCNEANRQYRLGAVGVRTDGTIVASSNIPTRRPNGAAHAEYRVCKKLDKGSIIYVVRIDRENGLRLARPCKKCLSFMRNSGIKRCYYSISEVNGLEYGVLEL